MKRRVRIDLHKERMKFSAGHFTVFSATKRENLHGHNFGVEVRFEAEVGDNGMVCDYRLLKQVIEQICDSLDETFLLPSQCPHLTIEEKDGLVWAHFADEAIPFLQRDITLLPVQNITVEELSHWFLQTLIDQLAPSYKRLIRRVEVGISSSPGQGATSVWSRP